MKKKSSEDFFRGSRFFRRRTQLPPHPFASRRVALCTMASFVQHGKKVRSPSSRRHPFSLTYNFPVDYGHRSVSASPALRNDPAHHYDVGTTPRTSKSSNLPPQPNHSSSSNRQPPTSLAAKDLLKSPRASFCTTKVSLRFSLLDLTPPEVDCDSGCTSFPDWVVDVLPRQSSSA